MVIYRLCRYAYKIHTIFDNNCTANNIVIGDFNANVTARFGRELNSFCADKAYIMIDAVILSPDSFAFYSAAHGTVSWLDHATSVHSAISNMDVLYDLLTSDHFPLGMNIEVDGLSKIGSPESIQGLRKLCKVN